MDRPKRLIAATPTPMDDNRQVDYTAIEALAAHLVRQGVAGAFVNGSTGEFSSLTLGERMLTAEVWRAAAAPGFSVIVHIGETCVENCKRLASHASGIGADAVAAIAPYYFKPGSVSALVDFCAEIAASAPGTPFYYYHIPALTGVDFPMRNFLREASPRIPNLAGIKFSHTNLTDVAQCVQFDGGRYDILFGIDEMLLGALPMGVGGAVGSTYNIAAPLYLRMIGAFDAGEMESARRDQQHIAEMVACIVQRGVVPGVKAVLSGMGMECGTVRLPLQSLSHEAARTLFEEFRASDYWPLTHEMMAQEPAETAASDTRKTVQ